MTTAGTVDENLAASSLFTLPNKLTSLRLVLAFCLFVTVWLQLWGASFLVFTAAAITDWLDGYFARKRGLISSLGRVYDPLVDKILVCGTFIFLAEARDTGLPGDAGLNAWMVTIVVTREFIVTALRGFLEDRGVSFGADAFGKIKMVLQVIAILWIFFSLSLVSKGYLWAGWGVFRDLFNWLAIGATFVSGANYVRKALTHLG